MAQISGVSGARSRTHCTSAPRLDLGDADAGGEAGDGLEVGLGELGADGVDAYPGRLGGENVGDHDSGLLFGVGRDGVLEVEHHGVRAGVEHTAEQLFVVAGREQVAAVHQITPCSRSSAMRSAVRPRRSV